MKPELLARAFRQGHPYERRIGCDKCEWSFNRLETFKKGIGRPAARGVVDVGQTAARIVVPRPLSRRAALGAPPPLDTD